jgi:phage terminase small subunit
MSDENQNGHKSNGNGHKPPKKSTIPNGQEMRIKKAAKAYVENGGNLTKAYIAAGNSRKSANSNAQRLKANERFAAAVQAEMARAAACAGISSDSVLGQLVRLAFYDPKDFCDKQGNIDYRKMKRNGKTYLIEQIETTERHSKDGSKRVTTKYQLPRKLPALEAMMRALGMEKEAAKNPRDAARTALEKLKQEYPDLPEGRCEAIIAKTHGVPIKDLTGDGQPAH